MKTPQEKKHLSYAKDRRNTYGENSKSSRQAIHAAKARANRAERHTQEQLLAATRKSDDAEPLAAVENCVRATPHRRWRKFPDTALGLVLARRRSASNCRQVLASAVPRKNLSIASNY